VDQNGWQVVCAGGAVLDRKFHLVAASVAGTSNPAGVSTSAGGVARNVAENLAGLLAGSGFRVELVSAVGDDEAGATLLAQLSERGVGVRHVRVRPGEATAQYIAVLEPGGELTIGIAAMAVLDRVDVAALDAAWPVAGRLFCDTNLARPVLAHAVRRARADGTRLAVDAVSALKVVRLPADLRGIDLLSCNRDEAAAWMSAHGRPVGGTDPQLAARLQAAGAACVLLTRGAAGVVVADREGVHELPAVRADVLDVTGAGDALVAGTLAALILADPSPRPDPQPGPGPGPESQPPADSQPRPDPQPGPDSQRLLEAVRAGIQLAARTVASPHSVLPVPR
jgi:pseudouridine kinase